MKNESRYAVTEKGVLLLVGYFLEVSRRPPDAELTVGSV
jgi:hypothetical protein